MLAEMATFDSDSKDFSEILRKLNKSTVQNTN